MSEYRTPEEDRAQQEHDARVRAVLDKAVQDAVHPGRVPEGRGSAVLSLAEALAALPTTADDIAAHLHAKGIQGVQEDSCNCPITNHLTGLGFHTVSVTLSRVIATRPGDRHPSDARMPWWIAEFVHRFDSGEWPELVLDDTAEDDDA